LFFNLQNEKSTRDLFYDNAHVKLSYNCRHGYTFYITIRLRNIIVLMHHVIP